MFGLACSCPGPRIPAMTGRMWKRQAIGAGRIGLGEPVEGERAP